jgi:hypothetical protein
MKIVQRLRRREGFSLSFPPLLSKLDTVSNIKAKQLDITCFSFNLKSFKLDKNLILVEKIIIVATDMFGA